MTVKASETRFKMFRGSKGLQIVGFQSPKTVQGMDFGGLKPYYMGTRTLREIIEGPQMAPNLNLKP